MPLFDDVLELARWVLGHPLIRENYALGGGTWLMLRHPRKARLSTDVDVFSAREEVSSFKAMSELVESCKRDKIAYDIIRRGEHFCQMFIEYPNKGKPTKVDIGKIWHPVRIEYDEQLNCSVISPNDMAMEKLRCIVDRIEPTDLYDLSLLRDEYPSEFRNACMHLKTTAELEALIAAINRRLETLGEQGTKLGLDVAQKEWLLQKIPSMIQDLAGWSIK